MEPDEHWLHSNRRQVIKTLGHLLEARKGISLSIEHAKLTAKQSTHCDAIINNIEALSQGINETIILCGQAADHFQQQMSDPNATPAPIKGKFDWVKITPFQRALQRDGKLVIDDIPTHIRTPKCQQRAPAPLPFNLTKKPRKSRAKHDPQDPPL